MNIIKLVAALIIFLLLTNILMADKSTELYKAIGSSDIQTVRELIKYGVNLDRPVDDYSTLPLSVAIIRKDTAILRVLIESGADVNNIHTEASLPLMTAISMDSLEIVKILIEAGADPNLKFGKDLDICPLIYAIYIKKFEVAKFLINSGSDIRCITNEGKTAYQYAVQVDAPEELLEQLKQ